MIFVIKWFADREARQRQEFDDDSVTKDGNSQEEQPTVIKEHVKV